ncbi:MAG: PIN domain-containing protein [Acidobacteria bacterium]|nr:PIN domain-containing protein [Acidobacteriota bacterium]
MIRAVLDTNIWIAAVLSSAEPPAEFVRRLEDGEFDAVMSPRLMEEMTEVLRRPWFSRRITGDRDLLDLQRPPIPIASPRGFLQALPPPAPQ